MFFFFFFNDTATTEIYTLSLHDALPISVQQRAGADQHHGAGRVLQRRQPVEGRVLRRRSEEHTSELQSPDHLVCRLLLEKKKKFKNSAPLTSERRPDKNRLSDSRHRSAE